MVEARRDLEIRVIDDPRDIGARLALAALAAEHGFPSEAIAQLETVEHLGGPLGIRWHAADRARLARLLLARGTARIARHSPGALGDLERAQALGATVAPEALLHARALVGLRDLRHVDATLRMRGKRQLAALSGLPGADLAWKGAREDAPADARAAFGAYLWRQGAKRAAWEELRAWHDLPGAKAAEPREAYLAAYAWWTPDAPRPASDDLVGPERCRFGDVPGCDPVHLVDESELDAIPTSALLAAPIVRTTASAEASAWAAIALVAALRGEGGWGPLLAVRVDLARLDVKAIGPHARPVFARLLGTSAAGAGDAELARLRGHERLLVAAQRALDGASSLQVRAALAGTDSAAGAAVLRIVEPDVGRVSADPFSAALNEVLTSRGLGVGGLASIVATYRKDPAIAERLARDAALASVDAANAHAGLGVMFGALGDPQRARLEWQAAVDDDPDPRHVAGLAEAIARAGDADAALIVGTSAAAASGDPATVWVTLARALHEVGKDVHALEAARTAIDLAGADTIVPALDVAIATSRALGRTAQADALLSRRRALRPQLEPDDRDPTDAAAALAAFARYDTVSTVARLWVASRWNPRDVETRAALLGALDVDDPRRRIVLGELIAFGSDRDPAIAMAALRALR